MSPLRCIAHKALDTSPKRRPGATNSPQAASEFDAKVLGAISPPRHTIWTSSASVSGSRSQSLRCLSAADRKDTDGKEGRGLLICSGSTYNAGMPAQASLPKQVAATVGETGARSLYFDDVWTWSRRQAAALRRRDWGALDLEKVIEEIEDVGNRHSDAWTSYCTNVISHLLKIESGGSSEDFRHWRDEIEAWRDSMFDLLADNPGMKHELSSMLAKAWKRGRRDAVRELVKHGAAAEASVEKRRRRSWNLQLPRECPYTLAEIAGYEPREKHAFPQPDVWPAPVAHVLNDWLDTNYAVRS